MSITRRSPSTDLLARAGRVLAPAGFNLVTPGTTTWMYASGEVLPDRPVPYRLLADSGRILLEARALRRERERLRKVHAAVRRWHTAPALRRLRAQLDEFVTWSPGNYAPIERVDRNVSGIDLARVMLTSAALLSHARILEWYDNPVSYVTDMRDNGIMVLRIAD